MAGQVTNVKRPKKRPTRRAQFPNNSRQGHRMHTERANGFLEIQDADDAVRPSPAASSSGSLAPTETNSAASSSPGPDGGDLHHRRPLFLRGRFHDAHSAFPSLRGAFFILRPGFDGNSYFLIDLYDDHGRPMKRGFIASRDEVFSDEPSQIA